jgi:hypothetical protein
MKKSNQQGISLLFGGRQAIISQEQKENDPKILTCKTN